MPAKLTRAALRLLALFTAVIAALWIYRAWLARDLPALQLWHTYEVQSEFREADFPDGISFPEYQQLEDRVFEELDDVVYATASGRYNRYNKNGDVYPGESGQQWNRSFELQHAAPRGGLLFIHGASDSPYSTLATARLFNDAGLYVLSLRLPGNGTVPSGLRDTTLDDWTAITRMGIRHVRSVIGADRPIYFAGYSIGGALALDYTVDSLSDAALETPSRLFLYTPAIGVSAAARFSSWDLLLSQFAVFEKFGWLNIEPEFDPYKFNSFAKNGGHLSYLLTTRLQKKFGALADKSALPPMIGFQSLVDSTIKVDALVNQLYMNLADNGSELILFDINRANDIEHFIDDTERDLIQRLASSAKLPFHYTLVSNTSGRSLDLHAASRPAGSLNMEAVPLHASWPSSVYSLSHVALMFRADDPWYGSQETGSFQLGALAPRGETEILRAPIGRFMRLRYNPFFDYLAARTLAFCNACQLEE